MSRNLKTALSCLTLALAMGFVVADSSFSTCTGADPCNACRDCKYCKHCAKEGGTCGVCKRSFKGRGAL